MKEKKKNLEGIIMILIAIIIVLCILIIYIVISRESSVKPASQNSGSVSSVSDNNNDAEVSVHEDGKLYKNASLNDAVCETSSKTPYVVGTSYNCSGLGDGKSYTFYVLNDARNTGTVDLIMDRDYSISSYSSSDGENSINAIKALPKTSVWTNSATPTSDVYNYSGYAARLPKASEIARSCNMSFNGNNSNGIYELTNKNCDFIFKNTQYVNASISYNGYYTETSDSNTTSWAVDSNNKSLDSDSSSNVSDKRIYDNVTLRVVDSSSVLGVRPVITLSK